VRGFIGAIDYQEHLQQANLLLLVMSATRAEAGAIERLHDDLISP
jgi:hypothetical protein